VPLDAPVAVYRDGKSIKEESTEIVTFAAALELVERGEAKFRDNYKKLTIFRKPSARQPESNRSAAALGVADAEALAGVRRLTKERWQRVEEWRDVRLPIVAEARS